MQLSCARWVAENKARFGVISAKRSTRSSVTPATRMHHEQLVGTLTHG